MHLLGEHATGVAVRAASRIDRSCRSLFPADTFFRHRASCVSGPRPSASPFPAEWTFRRINASCVPHPRSARRGGRTLAVARPRTRPRARISPPWAREKRTMNINVIAKKLLGFCSVVKRFAAALPDADSRFSRARGSYSLSKNAARSSAMLTITYRSEGTANSLLGYINACSISGLRDVDP